MDEIRAGLEAMLNRFVTLNNSFNIELENYPNGTLYCHNRNGRANYFCAQEENGRIIRRGITQNTHLIHQLARKRYIEEVNQIAEDNIRLLSKTLQEIRGLDGNEIIANLPRAYRDLPESYFVTRAVDPILQTRAKSSIGPQAVDAQTTSVNVQTDSTKAGYKQIASGIYVPESLVEAARQGTLTKKQKNEIREIQREWANQNYTKNTKKLEHKTVITSRDLKVRSMAEGAISASLYERDIPFRHDMVINVGNKTVSPDFSFLSIVRGVIHWEHNGMTNSRDYMNYQKYKTGLYEAAGFFPWQNFIVTYNEENGFFDMREIEAIIKNKLMRWLCLD